MGKKMGFISLLMASLWSPAVVSELSAEGDVSFIAVKKFDVGAVPGSVAVGDFNGDALEDLAVANFFSGDVGDVSILLGRGDGTFLRAQNFRAGAGHESVAVGDFNGDLRQDLAVSNSNSNDVSILLNDTEVSGEPPLCLGDVDGDGDRDTEDVVKILKHILGLEELTGTALENADVNQDGTVDFLDVVRLVLHIRGITPLPECG